VACLVLFRADLRSYRQPLGRPYAAPVGSGYGPADLQSAYNLPSSTAGSGETVAIVDAFSDPYIASDLATYRAAWGLPPCGAGCFSVVNQNGQPSPLPPANASWAKEESLDVDMVSAICPLCHILLVEANSDNPNFTDLGTAENTAVALGARFVSNSYAIGEQPADPTYDPYYNHPGVAIVAAAGDDGYGSDYPASSPYVTAVGGTTLTRASNPRGWTETVWNQGPGIVTASGCSAYEPKPSWQGDTGCANRTDNDVAAVATGVAVYDTYEGGWKPEAGTSVAAPIIAATFALAGPPAAGTYPSSYLYRHATQLYDVTSGANYTGCIPAYLCTAGPGYDGPTGWGTPDGIAAFLPWTNWLSEIGAPPPGIAGYSWPSVSSWAANRLDVFVRGTDNAIWHAWWDGTRWNAWESLGPAIVSSPAAVSWGPNRIDLFGVGADGNVWHKVWDVVWNHGWTSWLSEIGAPPPGIVVGSSPSVSSWAANRLDVFVLGTDNAIWHAWWDGTRWNAWESLGPTILSSPAAVSWGPNRIDLFGVGADGNVWHKVWDVVWNHGWTSWLSEIGAPPPGIAAGSSPSVSSWAANRLDVFVLGTDDAIWHAWWDGTRWNTWQSLGPAIVSSPAAVSWGPDQIDLFGVGTDGNVWHKVFGAR
jgi:hypothetical protein